MTDRAETIDEESVVAGHGRAGSRLPVVGLAVVLSGVFLAQFDFFVVNIAGPTIRTDLHAGPTVLELVIGAYAFAYAAGLLVAARLGGAVGYRRMFVVGAACFAASSMLCELSQSPTQLIVARLLQGGAASAMLPQVFAHITASLAPARRTQAITWYAVTASTGAVCGQVCGGLFVEQGGPGWRFIFAVNVPIGLVAAALAALVLPAPTGHHHLRFDACGAAGVTMTVAALLVPLTLGPAHQWPDWTRWCLAMVPALAVGTALVERRVARTGGEPIVSARLLRIRSFAVGLVGAAAFYLFFPGFMLTLTLLLQEGLRLDPLSTAMVLVPSGFAFAIGSLWARPLYARFGFLAPLGGCFVTVAGLAWLAALVMLEGTSVSPLVASALTGVISLGNGIVLPTVSAVALSEVPADAGGSAAGLVESSKQFAGAAGVALIGTVYFQVAGSRGTGVTAAHGAAVACCVDLVLVSLVAGALFGSHLTLRSRRPVRPGRGDRPAVGRRAPVSHEGPQRRLNSRTGRWCRTGPSVNDSPNGRGRAERFRTSVKDPKEESHPMPLIRVSMFPGRNASQKAELVRRLTQVFVETCGAPGQSTEGVWVVLEEVPESHWGVGGRLGRR